MAGSSHAPLHAARRTVVNELRISWPQMKRLARLPTVVPSRYVSDLRSGAGVNHKATFGGLTHGQGVTALHMASQNGHLSMVKLLIERGADPSIKDDLHGGDAAGHANFFGQASVRDYLNSLGGRIFGI
jgi:hypothetical protein